MVATDQGAEKRGILALVSQLWSRGQLGYKENVIIRETAEIHKQGKQTLDTSSEGQHFMTRNFVFGPKEIPPL